VQRTQRTEAAVHLVETTHTDNDSPTVRQPDAPVDRTVVRPWHDPTLDLVGQDPRGEYLERYWLGVVGPSVVLLVRRFARGLAEHPHGFVISLSDTARAIGLSGGTSRNSQISRTVERACMFRLLRRTSPDTLEVRTHVPLLTHRQLQRLPLAVRTSHQAWLEQTANPGPPAA
jgi:hypothetical protein